MEDAPALAGALNNKKVQDNLRDGLPYPYTENDAKAYIRAMLDADENTTFGFAILLDGQVVGSVGVFRRDNVHSARPKWAYYIAEPFWAGDSAPARSGRCVTTYLNGPTSSVFLQSRTQPTPPSCRILEKCGFTCEGTLRSNAVKNGKILDMKLYALIKD
jgi:RimJ/RimL family protein N-acetyltransferase